MSVAAVIVTHNRLAQLKECVDAVQNQMRRVDEIIVVNNESSDGTQEWLSCTPLNLTVIHQGNLGSGGGQNAGMRQAYGNGHDFVWCMDDDGRPSPDCLKLLFDHIDGLPAVYQPIVLSDANILSFYVGLRVNDRIVPFRKLDEIITSFPEQKLIVSDGNFFNGTLIHREILDLVGYPISELFIRGDEVEYAYRILNNKIPIYVVPASRYYHPKDQISTLWNTVIPHKPKMYFYVRNQSVILIRKTSWWRGYIKYCSFYAVLVLRLIDARDKFLSRFIIITKSFLNGLILPIVLRKSMINRRAGQK